MISQHIEEFAGKPVRNWKQGTEFEDIEGALPRIGLSYADYDTNAKWEELFAAFVGHPDAAQATGLVIGPWDIDSSEENSSPIIAALIEASPKLPNLRALFFGDIISEESEISWIQQGDITPLLAAYPALEYFTVRGGEGLKLEPFRHGSLRHFAIETGGLDSAVARAVAASELPSLEHLELWLGTENYGGTVTPEDLAPILQGQSFPKLTYLGLRNAEDTDSIARAVADAPVLERVQVLDLSMGDLTDGGAQALLDSPSIAKLQKLDLHHHFLSPEAAEKLGALPPEVNVDDAKKADEYDGRSYRYIAVSE